MVNRGCVVAVSGIRSCYHFIPAIPGEIWQSGGASPLPWSAVTSRINYDANVHDSQVLPTLLHGQETRYWGDSAYIGQRQAARRKALKVRDFTNRRATRSHALTDEERLTNRRKSSIRAKVDHAFGIIKRVFGFAKVRYRGLQKNAHLSFVTSALANLFMVRRRLMRMQGA